MPSKLKVTAGLLSLRATGMKGEVEITSPKPEDLATWLQFAGMPAERAADWARIACSARESPGSMGGSAEITLSWRTADRRRVYRIAWDRPLGARVPR